MSRSDGAITAELIGEARQVRFEDLPSEALEVARHCVLDWLGVTLAGSREPLADIVRRVAGTSPGTSPEDTRGATLIGRSERCSPLTAALINGAASHALDYDDTHSLMSGHPTVPVLPAVLALAERDRRSGRDALAAFVAGVELECRVGALVNPAHYQRGFHATATLGGLGAAAACAHLLRLDEQGWRHALGLAATQAAGLKSAFGSMAKPLHAGRAAQSGLLAALLAAEGFTAHPAAVETEQGFCDTLAGVEPDRSRLEAHRGRFLIRDTLFKYHAACFLTHSAIEGALTLRRRLAHRQDPEPDSTPESSGESTAKSRAESAAELLAAIERVEVTVAPSSLQVCNLQCPTTGLEGKFSLRATTAMALLGDRTGDFAAFSDRRMADLDLVELRDRVEVLPVEGTSPTRSPVAVLVNGERLEAAVDVGRPAADLETQSRRLRQKFLSLAEPVIGAGAAAELQRQVESIAELDDVSELLARTTPGRAVTVS